MAERLRQASRARQRGVSLIELMISMTLGLVITGAVSAVYLNSTQSRADLDRIGQLNENARFAVDLVTEDLRHGGFYGPFVPSVQTVFTAPTPCTVAVAQMGWNLAATPPQMPAAIGALQDPAALPAGWDCLPNARPGMDVLTLRRVVETPVLPGTIASSAVPYVQASQCTTDTTRALFSANSGDFTLRNLACQPASTAPVPVRQYITRTYFVATCNVCSPNDGVATLKRLEMRDGQLREQALAEGVVNLQFQYGFDTDNDGNVDEFLQALNGVAGDPRNDWANVVAVRMSVLLQTVEAVSGEATTRTFDLGPGHDDVACPAGRRCMLATNTVRLINVAARREQP
jgi:type IV pilus assembly protein PilW